MDIFNKQNDTLQRQQILDKAQRQLKKEFAGIDRIIDQVIEGISSWYLFPELQEKPVVINLWGLTGVGKTSLVNRLTDLIEFKDRYLKFDLGEGEQNSWAMKNDIESFFETHHGKPAIFALDEFQHARSIDDKGSERDIKVTPIIWQILDSGKFSMISGNYMIEELYDLAYQLRHLVRKGVAVKHGRIINNADLFLDKMDLRSKWEFQKEEKKNDAVNFVPKSFHKYIFELDAGNYITVFDVEEYLEKLDAEQTIDYLLKVAQKGNAPKEIDCSRSIIFVMGNLDEAYTMSSDYNPDMDADEFHAMSKKITIPAVKTALKCRFRNEQIARLGNQHIIYPALNSASYYKIIWQELEKLSAKIKGQYDLDIRFDETIVETIYSEGVYPTQGTRPLFTTIDQLVKTKIGRIVADLIRGEIKCEYILFMSISGGIKVEYRKGKEAVHQLELPQEFELQKLRRVQKDDNQAIVAVHEAGHAVLSVVLMHVLPEVIYSHTVDTTKGGYVYGKFEEKYLSKKGMMNRLTMLLGGLAAEQLVFGEEHITSGAESDIERGTSMVMQMVKGNGMGLVPGYYHNSDDANRYYLNDFKHTIDQQVEVMMCKAMEKAIDTLKEQYNLLLHLANHLSDHRMMRKEAIYKMVKNYAEAFDITQLEKDRKNSYYRAKLKSKLTRIHRLELFGPPLELDNLVMNNSVVKKGSNKD